MNPDGPSIHQSEVAALVADALRAFLTDTQRAAPAHGVDAGTRVFGEGGVLDSLGLIGFVADVETRVAERFGREIVLADERAMSRARSPFRTVETLAQLVAERLAEPAPEEMS